MTNKNPYFDNPFADFTSTSPLWSDAHKSVISERKETLLKMILDNPPQKDNTIYTGNGGTCVLLLRLYQTTSNPDQKLEYLKECERIIENILQRKLQENTTFLIGNAGIYALAAVVYFYLSNFQKMNKFIQDLISCCSNKAPNIEYDEIISGRAGYLHALLFTLSHTKNLQLLMKAEEIALSIIDSGRSSSTPSSPLMFQWLSEKYVGFAHGIAGIMYMVMLVYQMRKRFANLQVEKERKGREGDPDPSENVWDKVMEDVKGCLDFLCTTVMPSGNYPPVIDENYDLMVQWCHGAPGVVLTFCKAYEVFNHQEYLEAAMRGCDVTWERGLLKKGFGLCHGISGNAYAFLATYKVTKDKKFLYRALKFSDFGWDDEALLMKLIMTPDAKNSLFEGIGGQIYFLNDLLLLNSDDCFVIPDFPTFEM